MFNVKVLDEAIRSLSDEGKEEIRKMIEVLEGYKSEVEKLTEIAEGFELTCIKFQKENEALKAKLNDYGVISV